MTPRHHARRLFEHLAHHAQSTRAAVLHAVSAAATLIVPFSVHTACSLMGQDRPRRVGVCEAGDRTAAVLAGVVSVTYSTIFPKVQIELECETGL